MIQAYLSNNTNYAMNGDMTLQPTACTLKAALNGTWVLEMQHSVDPEGKWKYIEDEGVISAPTFMGENQLFRIDDITKSDTVVNVTAYPIFLDSADDCFLKDTRPEGKTGQQALNAMMSGSIYTGESDINMVATAYFQRRNLIDAIQGDTEPTFLGRWGGEVLYRNYTVIINSRAGSDKGMEIRYGKNMNGISYKVDMSEVVTCIVPVAYNGRTIGDKSGHVDSPLISRYAKKYIKEIKFENIKLAEDVSEGAEEDVVICSDQAALDMALKSACTEQFELGLDKPKVTIEINMIDLSATEEYKDFIGLEAVSLGDTVHCTHNKLGITTTARVKELEWDCIKNKSSSVKLGDYENITDALRRQTAFAIDGFSKSMEKNTSDIAKIGKATTKLEKTAKKITSILEGVVDADGNLIAEKINGVINAANAMIKAQTQVAQTQEVRAMLFEDLNPKSSTYGAMCIGTKGLMISNKRTADGTDWQWTTFGTGNGFLADCITAGTMSADRIHGGLLVLGGLNNISGQMELKDKNGKEIIIMGSDGITLKNGASLLSANGVCGNLQYLSGGGTVQLLGCSVQMSVYHQNLYISAYIPSNYVIASAYLTLKTAPATWDKMSGTDVVSTLTGYPREIELNYSDDAGIAIWGETYGEYTPVSENFAPVPSDMLGGFAGKPNGVSSGVKNIKSGNLANLLTLGEMNMLEITSKIVEDVSSDAIWTYTGAGIAILDIIGYTKN